VLPELRTLFRRDLDALRAELTLYGDDRSPWANVPGCPNPGGTLVLHAVGNLRHFVGAQLGGTGYVRQRDAEFATRGLSRAELTQQVDAARAEVDAALARLTPADLERPASLPTGDEVATSLWLLHLLAHLEFHLGQLDYHRRAATGDSTSAGALSLKALAASED
jgi:hypothetical protein